MSFVSIAEVLEENLWLALKYFCFSLGKFNEKKQLLDMENISNKDKTNSSFWINFFHFIIICSLLLDFFSHGNKVSLTNVCLLFCFLVNLDKPHIEHNHAELRKTINKKRYISNQSFHVWSSSIYLAHPKRR
jgi:hypothetical protein